MGLQPAAQRPIAPAGGGLRVLHPLIRFQAVQLPPEHLQAVPLLSPRGDGNAAAASAFAPLESVELHFALTFGSAPAVIKALPANLESLKSNMQVSDARWGIKCRHCPALFRVLAKSKVL